VFDETNGSQVEQVDLNELDDEEAPCIALRNMSIGDVCPKESEEPPQAQDQPSSSMKDKIKKMSHFKRRAKIKGEMPMIKMRRMNKFQGRHTQESTKQFNEITP
jgi:hypothetical protein